MSPVRASMLLALLATAACGAQTNYDVAIMPRNAGGTPVMSDQGAIGLASYALGNRSSIEGHPAEAQAFDAADVAGQRSALPGSVFTRGPDQTIALLTHLPQMPAANVAAQRTNQDINSNCFYTNNCS